MKTCPKCNATHQKPGTFCSRKCANSREKSGPPRIPRQCKKCGETFIAPDNSRASKMCDKHREAVGRRRTWEQVSLGTKKARLIRERGHRCEVCKLSHWLGKLLILELHHINATYRDDSKENLQLLCPNCHSLTPNFGWKRMHNKIPCDSAGDESRLSTEC